jgi:hypothetical protein
MSVSSDDDFVVPPALHATATASRVARHAKNTVQGPIGLGRSRKRQKVRSSLSHKENIESAEKFARKSTTANSSSKLTLRTEPQQHTCVLAATKPALPPSSSTVSALKTMPSSITAHGSPGQTNGLPATTAEACRREEQSQQDEPHGQDHGLSDGISRHKKSAGLRTNPERGRSGSHDHARHQDDSMAIYLSQLDGQTGMQDDATLYEECFDDLSATAGQPTVLPDLANSAHGRGSQTEHQVSGSQFEDPESASVTPHWPETCNFLGPNDMSCSPQDFGDEFPDPCQALSDEEDWNLEKECRGYAGDAPASTPSPSNSRDLEEDPGADSREHACASPQERAGMTSTSEVAYPLAYDPGPLVQWLAGAGLEKFEHIFTKAEVRTTDV